MYPLIEEWVKIMVFIATFNIISVISWQSVLLVEEIGLQGENYRPVSSHWQTLSYNVVSSTTSHEQDSNLWMNTTIIREIKSPQESQ
jgi:hypothetical protein